MNKPKIIFLSSHPINYFVDLYKYLSAKEEIDVETWFTSSYGVGDHFDKEFNSKVNYKSDLLSGYKYTFLKAISISKNNSESFFSQINFEIIKKLFQLKRGSIIICHGWRRSTMLFVLIFGKFFGHKICLKAESPLCHEEQYSAIKLFARKIIFKYLLFKRIDYFLYIGQQNKMFYQKYGVPNKKLIFSPYSINNDFFEKEYDRLLPLNNDLRKKYGFSNDDFIIISSGKLINKKRPLDITEALIGTSESLKLLFVGSGPLEEEIIKFTKLNKLQGRVSITGFVDQSVISEYYSICDLYIMSSTYGETWGLSTNEVMNFRKPVIISDRVGCHSDLVKNNGYVFKCGNTKHLRELIEKVQVSGDKFLYGEESLNIISNYSYETIFDNLIKIV